ncbi:MAG: hypothetical protein N2423_00245 [Novosphingobium sp.]|nr:hypothetical protein [Novosphingobium sp.]
MHLRQRVSCRLLPIAALLLALPLRADADSSLAPASLPEITYADLADLADSAPLVLRARILRLARVENERAPGLKAGQGRFYVQAQTQALLAGTSPLGESLAYLVDLPLDAKGRPPKLKKQVVLLFARPIRNRPGEIQLVSSNAQLPWSEQTETRLRALLSELLSPGAPGRISGVREIIHVPGTLAGEGETQIFLETVDGSPASITVSHRPGRPPAWGASFSELVANVSQPPQRDTLAWYRLACFLPNSLPREANLSESPEARARALADYRLVLAQLGVCQRNLR